MQQTRWAMKQLLWMLGFATLSSACGKPDPDKAKPITELVVDKAPAGADLRRADPNAEFWDDVPMGSISLTAQPMIAPRPETTTTERVTVQAVHDGERVAFRLQWRDSERSAAGRLGAFSDAFALEFPVREDVLPPVMMGAKDMPVVLLHWRAQYQVDEEKGKPTTEDLYPNASIDMYPHEFKSAPGSSAEAAEKYAPAKALGNPQAYRKSAVDTILAEGFGTSAVQAANGSVAKGEWKDGRWTLVIIRPLALAGGNRLRSGASSNVAFAAWQGGEGEVASRKSVTMQWTPMRVR